MGVGIEDILGLGLLVLPDATFTAFVNAGTKRNRG
jgi:hypothetical protein